jgi:superfamily I DNA/RNA helicase/Zn-dependent peptidase ImmA (M78 family)
MTSSQHKYNTINKECFLSLFAGYSGILMDQRIQTLAEAAARLLLHHYRQAHLAWDGDKLPLDHLVNWLGLDIATFHPDDHPKGTYGFMDADEDEHLIWLCQDLSETLRRFTLAHELGHALLHCVHTERIQTLLGELGPLLLEENAQQHLPELSRIDPCQENDIQEDINGPSAQEHMRDILGGNESDDYSNSYNPRSQRELAANIFAAELLMPLDRVQALYLAERNTSSTLANHFGVSNAALLTRLAGLLQSPEITTSVSTELILETIGKSKTAQTSAPTPSTKKNYDEFQQAAIETETPALIIAGPGSGKTSTLIGRVEYLINTQHVPAGQILALTFSRKATQEMQERLEKMLPAGVLPRVSTFHAFCADLLRQHGKLVGMREDFTLIDEAEGYFLLRQQANHLRLRHYQKLQAPAYYFPDMLKAISRAKDELITPDDYTRLAQQMLEQAQEPEARQEAEKALEIAQAYSIYEGALQRRGDSDFGGLLVSAVRLLREQPEIRAEQQQKYQHILVDEFQDVNRASAVLLRELAGEEQRVWVVGDANQAIYGFRGASPANISQFSHDFPGAHILPLSRNYRSRPDLVALAESFRCTRMEIGQKPGKNQPVRLTHPDSYVTLAQASDDLCELTGIIADIRYKQANGYAYKDMIVLCRTRSHVQKISHALANAGLPVIERGGVLEQEHIKDLLSILLLLTNATGLGLLRAAHQPEHPFSQADIEALLLTAHEQKRPVQLLLYTGEAPLTMSIAGRHALDRLSTILQTLQHAPDTWSVLAQYLLLESNLICDLLRDHENKQNQALLADYDYLLQLARHYDQQQQQRFKQHAQEALAQDKPVPELETLEERLKGFLEYLSLLILLRQDGNNRQGAEDGQEESADVIRVMTVHASKGLEFPVVYMPGLVERRFPLQARSSPISAPHGMLPPESIGAAAHSSGEACLFYVGVTRARDELILSYSERYGKVKYKRSLYLDALEMGLPTERLRILQWEQKDPQLLRPEEPIRASSQPSEHFIQRMKPDELKSHAIEAYQRCPRQYAYSAIYGFSGSNNGYQLFWQAMQRTLESLRQHLQTKDEQPTQQEIQALYSKHWQALGGETVFFGAMYEEHGHEVAEFIQRDLIAQESITWETRSGYSVTIAGKMVQVTIDRVEMATSSESSGTARFVRTRFGKQRDKPTIEMRELFYTLAYRQLHPDKSVELHSHNMSTGEITPIKLTAKKEEKLHEEVEQSIKGMEGYTYPAQPAEPFRCPTCPFFLICPS